jgi:hypothetical protein
MVRYRRKRVPGAAPFRRAFRAGTHPPLRGTLSRQAGEGKATRGETRLALFPCRAWEKVPEGRMRAAPKARAGQSERAWP